MAGFRGFKDKTRFELPSGFAVLTGRNGSGKSTVLDAIDFALTGTINKYSVTAAKGGGLDEHIWWVGDGIPDGHYVSVGFTNQGGDAFTVTRSRERGLHPPHADIASKLCSLQFNTEAWSDTLMQTTLIRDETIAALSMDLPQRARFEAVRTAIGGLIGPDHTERTTAISKAAAAAKSEQEARVGRVREELGRALTSLTEARSAVERVPEVSEAQQIVDAIAPDLATSGEDRTALVRRRLADRRQSIAILQEALGKAEAALSVMSHFESPQGKAQTEEARVRLDAAQKAKQEADKRLTAAHRQRMLEQERDGLVDHLAAVLKYGELVGLQDGHCPLCGTAHTQEAFTNAIRAARELLSKRTSAPLSPGGAVDQARLDAEQADAGLSQAQRLFSELETKLAGAKQDLEAVASTFAEWSFDAPSRDPQSARRLLLQRQEEAARLERALFILDAYGAQDRVTALQARLVQLREQADQETARLLSKERAVEAARQIDNAAKEVTNQVLEEQFDTVMPLLKELFERLRPHADWREIEIDFGGRVRASLNFTVGEGRNPQFLFSSGQRRAAGIAFLLSIHLSRPWCLLDSLLLDDPVQHVDDYRALNLVEVLSAVRRMGRQVVVSVEDPALADVLCRRLRSTALEPGRRFELSTSSNGSATIEHQEDIFPLLPNILRMA